MWRSNIMKRNTTYNYIIFFAIVIQVGLTACNDWLGVKPSSGLIKENFWTKTADVDGALAATYDSYRDYSENSFILGEVRADIFTLTENISYPALENIAGSNISPSNSFIKWSDYYRTINYANTLMYYDNQVLAKDESFTKEMKDRTDGEALFLRALNYFYLIRLWKDVPLVTQPSVSDTGNLFVPTSSEHEVINQILTDLNTAKEKIGPVIYQSDLRYLKGRANKYSIMALLSDVYLWNEQYQKCIDYCDSIINSGLFGLEPTETWFKLYYPGNSLSESIFEIQFDDGLDGQENPIYDDYLPITSSGDNTDYIGIKENVLKTLYSPEDIRTCGTYGPIWKYRGIAANSSTMRTMNERDANFIYYRYADILLMKSEALNELNNIGEANEYLRLTEERAGLSYTDILNKTDMRTAILNERAREFALEGKRWFDILRFAKRDHFANKQIIIDMILSGADVQQQAVLRTKALDTMSYYLPIPEREILYNPNLEQNPYYDR
jgi:starch-binding outer membrane protein, SusD/RagB family